MLNLINMKYKDIESQKLSESLMETEIAVRELGKKCKEPKNHAIRKLEELDLTSRKWRNRLFLNKVNVDRRMVEMGEKPKYFPAEDLEKNLVFFRSYYLIMRERQNKARAIAKSLLDVV